ncbi:hypothetical protein ELQ35_12215 [Peribacillus cavernae]|uniref:Uncharacterized protein n=1 Tax=Peribacillus cavernae TaxID=1674310 RepID=A0A3S0VM81_9BACI|nr:hypothetical protein [Peribacillus cavernae]MDQ0219095.1 hypothetical protein [Peribacillus cavernae]RUQ28670.1 hypothetical protein ELQ35_12215 [Peribacillus cavernae]
MYNEFFSTGEVSLKHTNTILNSIEIEGELNWEHLFPIIKSHENTDTQETREKVWKQLFNSLGLYPVSNEVIHFIEESVNLYEKIHVPN